MHTMSMGDNMKKDFATTVGESLSLPAEAISNVALIQLRGRRSLSIEHHSGIGLYTDEEIRIHTKQGILCVYGRGLKMVCMQSRYMELRGTIDRLEWV